MLKKIVSVRIITIEKIGSDWHTYHPLESLPALPNSYQLPRFLPTKWAVTAADYGTKSYDPKKSGSRSNFIRCSRNPVPNLLPSKTTSCVRADLVESEKVILKTCEGPKAICYAHGNYVDIQMLDADHLQASSLIVKRQIALIDAMNKDPVFGEQVYSKFKSDHFFIHHTETPIVIYKPTPLFLQHFPSSTIIDEMNKDAKFAKIVMKDQYMSQFITTLTPHSKKTYIGTRLFYKAFHNDINNLWLICKKCNGGNAKHNQDPISWFKSNPLYGKRFLRAISPIKTDGVLLKTKSGKGLAEAAKEWFWVTHLKRVIRDRLTNSIFYQLIGYSNVTDIKENRQSSKRQRISMREEHRAFQTRNKLIQELIDSQDLFDPISFTDPAQKYVFDEFDHQKSIASFVEAGKKGFELKQLQLGKVYSNWERFAALLKK